MYHCTNDRYSNTHEPFDSVEDFQAMCMALFDEEADLYEDGGDYYDRHDGALTLTPVAEAGR